MTNTSDSGPGSLRDAIASTPAGGKVDFNLKGDQAGNPGSHTITLTGGMLEIAKNLTIEGPGMTLLTVSGDDKSEVFRIDSGVTVTISGLTVSHGKAAHGGGIFNAGFLTLTQAAVTNNTATDPAGASGGGIDNTGQLALTDVDVSDNKAASPAAKVGREGRGKVGERSGGRGHSSIAGNVA